MIFHASRTTHVAASQTDAPIASEGTIKVLGIIVESIAGGSGGQVVVEQGDGSTVIMKISVLVGDTKTVDIPFVADFGLNITTPGGVTCTVFHTQVL